MITQDIIDNVTNQAYKFGLSIGLSQDDIADLTQEALMAVVELVNDKPKAADFATYAYATAAGTMMKWRNERQNTVIPVPKWIGEELSKAHAVEVRLQQQLGREPTHREVASALDVTLEDYEKLRATGEYEQMDVVPEGDPFLDLDTDTFEDGVDSEGVLPGPEKIVSDAELEEVLAKELEYLTAQECEVMSRMYGLRGYEPHTAREAGAEMGFSHVYALRIRDRALRKLRHRLPPEFREVESLSLDGRTTA